MRPSPSSSTSPLSVLHYASRLGLVKPSRPGDRVTYVHGDVSPAATPFPSQATANRFHCKVIPCSYVRMYVHTYSRKRGARSLLHPHLRGKAGQGRQKAGRTIPDGSGS